MTSAGWPARPVARGIALKIARQVARALAVLLLAAVGTIALTRFAPGYFTDAREFDARYAGRARAELAAEQTRHSHLWDFVADEARAYAHGDLGISRQYETPVLDLLKQRAGVSGALLVRGVLLGWMVAALAALVPGGERRGGRLGAGLGAGLGASLGAGLLGLPFTLLLATPIAAMATACLLWGHGDATLVLAALVAARDFKFLRRALREEWAAPHVLMARGMGLRWTQLLARHILPGLMPRLGTLAALSFLTAISAIVPLEVLFDLPGLGQLAWSAAINRDVPVLLAVTLLVAASITVAGALSDGRARVFAEATA